MPCPQRPPHSQGNAVVSNDEGGYIVHKKTGRQIHFVEREGACFVRMKMPNAMQVDSEGTPDGDDPMSGFTRPEA